MTTSAEPSRDPTAYLLLHTFLGPVFGTLFVLITQMAGFATLGHFAPRAPDVTAIFLLFVVVLLPAWFFGFIPALFHAVLMLVLRRIVPSRRVWLALTPFAGAFAVILPLLLFGVATSREGVPMLIHAGLIGSVAALCCQAIAWRKRLFPVF